MLDVFKSITDFIRNLYSASPSELIPLHAPVFKGNEKKYVLETIDSTFVSSVGQFVNKAEELLTSFTQSPYVIATGNGTLALHAALVLAGVKYDDEVITQPLTFVATGNAIKYCGANPVFIDVDLDTAGLSPESLASFLKQHATLNANGDCINKLTGKTIRACVPMHTFGLVCRINEIAEICSTWNIILVEDAAESIGSYTNNTHTGRIGQIGTLSFNGNKTITCGGGGAILTHDETIARRAKHITTTAKIPHSWEFYHDEIGYNYRLPNLNAALLVAQIEELPAFIKSKRTIAEQYHNFFDKIGIKYLTEIKDTASNFWLNALLLESREQRDLFLEYTNKNLVMTRPAWTLLNKLPAFKDDFVYSNNNAQWLEDRIVNIPSSVIL